jgi:hypothetical protein
VNPWLPAILAALGTVLVAAIGYALKARSSSGKIETSEAADLWKEGKDMRDALIAEIVSLRTELKALKDEITQLRAELRGRP